jgi:hypothetical protein
MGVADVGAHGIGRGVVGDVAADKGVGPERARQASPKLRRFRLCFGTVLEGRLKLRREVNRLQANMSALSNERATRSGKSVRELLSGGRKWPTITECSVPA